jgi:ubiquinone/menaquinone biosynthesis C-methylase UbiE
MPSIHFVEDYERHVADLIAQHPIDEAMSLAVGGSYEETGAAQFVLLQRLGLRDGMTVVDLGCGSGRTATQIGRRFQDIKYTGIDVVGALLEYARKKCPAHFNFIQHRDVNIPLDDGCADLIYVFSVFTHLLHEEIFLYMEDARRVLKPGGRLIFSFFEFAAPHHWEIFSNMVSFRKGNLISPLVQFIEQPVLRKFAERIGFTISSIENDSGQSLAVFVAV